MINLNGSKLRIKLFDYYFSHPGCELYLREAARKIQADPTNLLREFNKLEAEGVFLSRKSGKQKYYKLNKKYFFYRELKKIVASKFGIEKKMISSLKAISSIELCFIYGSYASGKEKSGSDIDLFVIGKIHTDRLLEIINRLEKKIEREINYRVMTAETFEKEKKLKNSFILNIIKNKKIILIGDEKYLKTNS
ncbi:MAG: nucleotidyltransferase domain-containing protein [Patescibacteria group bacterium]|nr:nucleotidyltransferase domain-containing protein [Patescibacteria group bacterium]